MYLLTNFNSPLPGPSPSLPLSPSFRSCGLSPMRSSQVPEHSVRSSTAVLSLIPISHASRWAQSGNETAHYSRAMYHTLSM